ncbi:MAG TPA: hypothetical protein VJA26_05410 [Gammaproteobacteria bacterium]|nr:hypothetical protein [Gammaproteobacteria bacterium]
MTIAFFGCNGRAGHFLWESPHEQLRDFECDQLGFPKSWHLDGGPLFLPRPERVGEGMLTHLPAPNITILAWWGSPFDKRGAVNSAIIVSGNVRSIDAIWFAFEKGFPELAKQLQRPVVRNDGQ